MKKLSKYFLLCIIIAQINILKCENNVTKRDRSKYERLTIEVDKEEEVVENANQTYNGDELSTKSAKNLDQLIEDSIADFFSGDMNIKSILGIPDEEKS